MEAQKSETGLETRRVIDLTAADISEIVCAAVHKILDQRIEKPPERFYSRKELRELLGCSMPLLHTMLNQGKIESTHIPGTRRRVFTKKNIDDFILHHGDKFRPLKKKQLASDPE